MSERETVLAGGGEMGARMRALDWGSSALGPVEDWPGVLRTSVALMLALPTPALLYWGEARVVLYNDSVIPLVADKHPAILGQPLRQVIPELWEVLSPLLDAVMRTQTASYLESQPLFINRRGFAEEAYFTYSYTPLRDERGRPRGIFCGVNETTRQVLGERRFKNLRELSLRTALALDAGDVLRGAEQVLAGCGPDVPFALLYRVEADAPAHLVLCVGLEADARGARDGPWPLAEVLRSGEERLLELTAREPTADAGPDGLHAGPWPEPVRRALLLPLALGGGGHDAVLVVGLSPRLPLDDGYHDFVRLLARQLTADVTRARALAQEKQRAEQLAALDRAKTDFFSNVSHEFRTPLTLLLGPLEDTLADPGGTLPPEHRERLSLAQRNAARLSRLVNSLLDFSRLEAGRAHVAFRPVDLAALTTELASHFESAARRVGLVLTLNLSPLAEPVWVDPEAWEKIVFNLLSNALKHTFKGGITVGLRVESGHAVLRVSDSGVGIAAEALPRLFERFQRVEGARARSHEGSGIGLALVRELVRLHGGEVSVESVPGEGSTFRVHLPLGRAHLPPEHLAPPSPSPPPSLDAEAYAPETWIGPRERSTPPPGAPSARGSRARVLVVDDNADMRAYVSGILAPAFKVETAEDGLAALEAARARVPDLVLSDVMMPRLGGFGLLREVRASPVLRAVPFVLLSARAGEEASVEGLEAGADDYLVKPFGARELLARVRAHLELARMRREAAALLARESGLREAVHARDDFLSVASHELKTPLAALRLQLELHERALSSDARTASAERLLAVRRQTQRLAELVEAMLDVSLLASGQLQLRRERADLTRVVTDHVAQAREELARGGCALVLHLAPSMPGDFDVPRVGQLVRGLLSNAARFGPGRPVEVRLERSGARAVLEVVDHGIGVKPEQREHIFQRFGRAESARQYGGLGLGLWVSRRVVEAHGGTLAVEDTPGGGATFTVELPLDPDAMDPGR